MADNKRVSCGDTLSKVREVNGAAKEGCHGPASVSIAPEVTQCGKKDDKHQKQLISRLSCISPSTGVGEQMTPTRATVAAGKGMGDETELCQDDLSDVVREGRGTEPNFHARSEESKTPAATWPVAHKGGGFDINIGDQGRSPNSTSSHSSSFPGFQEMSVRENAEARTEMADDSELALCFLVDVVRERCCREERFNNESKETSFKLMATTSSNTEIASSQLADFRASKPTEQAWGAGDCKTRENVSGRVSAHHILGAGKAQDRKINLEDSGMTDSEFLMHIVRKRASQANFNAPSEPMTLKLTAIENNSHEDLDSHPTPADLGPSEKKVFGSPENFTKTETVWCGANQAQEDGGFGVKAMEPGAFAVPGINTPLDQSADVLTLEVSEAHAVSPFTDVIDTSGLSFLEATVVQEGGSVEGLILATQVKRIWCCTIDCPCLLERSRLIFAALIALVVIAAVAVGLGLGFGGVVTPTASVMGMSTLERIQKRGALRCGIGPPSPGMNVLQENGERSGLDVALCRALAAAALGEDATVEFLPVAYKMRFPTLAFNEVDVLAAEVTHTMERQVYEAPSKVGFTFSAPYLYLGLHFAGIPKYVECTENGLKLTGECANLRICALDGTTPKDMLSQLLPERHLYAVRTFEEMVEALSKGDCSIIGAEGYPLYEAHVRELGYKGDYEIGNKVYSKEPLCLVSRSDDPEWSSFVNVVLHGLFSAEKYNITKATAHLLPPTDIFGDKYKNLFRDSLAVEGNYGELYYKHMEPHIPRGRMNSINAGPERSGLLWSRPMGAISNEGSPAIGYMDQIQQRGKIRCGVIPGRLGFTAIYPGGTGDQGLDINLCGALSAALFSGLTTEVDIVHLSSEIEGYAALHGGLVDVFAGATWNLHSYTYKSSKGSRVAFSQPYFYNNSGTDETQENLCLVTAADDHSWSSFVYWVLEGLIQAEEVGILMEDGNDMPEVNVFGPHYYQMFRDMIHAVGNFGQLYNASLEQHFPRSGRNLFNKMDTPGPQIYPLPGLNSFFERLQMHIPE